MRITAICLFLWASGMWGSAAALEGVVKAPDGHPIKNAQVRIEAASGKFSKTITTDAKGYYFCGDLTIGAQYNVTLLVNGAVKASILKTKIQPGNTTQLSFNLRQEKGSAKHHMVWVPQETGTHIGSTSGRWVEVDENGQVVNNVNQDVVRTGSDYAKQLENSKSNTAVGR